MERGMRVTQVQRAKNRARIVATAARLMRRRGIAGVGVDAVAKAAGMTHGAIYSQFATKDDLAAAAITDALATAKARWRANAARAGAPGSPEYFGELVRQYVSRAHRDNPGEGCAVAAMGPDAMRYGTTIRRAFARHIETMIADFAPASAEPGTEAAKDAAMDAAKDSAIETIALMVGSIVIARAIEDQELSDRMLLTVRRRLLRGVGGRTRAPSPP
jgi:TetR/AcrR family transcriptional repressor of nem operon